MATIKLQISRIVNKQTNKGELLLRFCGGRDFVLRCKTRIFVNRTHWDDQRGVIIIPRGYSIDKAERNEVSRKIELLQRYVIDSFNSDEKEPTSEWLQHIVDQFHHNTDVNAQRYIQHISQIFNIYLNDTKVGDARKEHITVCLNAILRYEEYKGIKLTPKDITPKFLTSFEAFYKNEPSKSNKPTLKRGRNTVSSKMKIIRAFIYWAIKKNYLTTNPFKEYTLPTELYGTPYYITIEERNAIYQHDFSNKPHIAIQRDIFIFQCFIGCRVGDLVEFTTDNIIDNAIEYVANKTKTQQIKTIRVPLNHTALEIIERNKDPKSKKLLPFIYPQKYNAALKKIFKEAGITRQVTVINSLTGLAEQRPINELASSHMARRCFIGNLYKKVKDPNLIGSLTGHVEGSKAFARYREIDEDLKKELVDMLE